MAEQRPLISVVVPAYQAASTIGATLASLLWQTYGELEVVVVDDGSTDATSAVVGAHDDPRIRLVRQDNAGPGAARNRGLAQATGSLLAFVDADDVLMPDYLTACSAVWQQTGGIVTSNAYWMFPGGIHPSLTRHRGPLPAPAEQRLALLQQNWVSIMSLFPRRLVDEVGPLAEDLPRAEDWDFWLRAVYAGWTVAHQPRPLALFNRSRESQTSSRELVFASEQVVLDRMAARTDLRDEERRYLALRIGAPSPGQLVEQAEVALLSGRYHQASRRLSRAAALVPSERELALKSRLLRLSPGLVGPVLRRRSRERERRLGGPPTSG